jgi:hypothetical protein
MPATIKSKTVTRTGEPPRYRLRDFVDVLAAVTPGGLTYLVHPSEAWQWRDAGNVVREAMDDELGQHEMSRTLLRHWAEAMVRRMESVAAGLTALADDLEALEDATKKTAKATAAWKQARLMHAQVVDILLGTAT